MINQPIRWTTTRSRSEQLPRLHRISADPLHRQQPNLFAVFGVDRTFADALNVNVQALYKHAFDWRDPTAWGEGPVGTLAGLVDVISNQVGSDNAGVSAHLDLKVFNETLEAEVTGLSWFRKGDGLVRPTITYALTDHFKVIAGAQVYFGPKDSFFGQLKPVSTAFVELRCGI